MKVNMHMRKFEVSVFFNFLFSIKFMFVLMCGWEEKWGSCSPPGLVMKFALFCDHQRDAKCDTFWELSKVFPKSSGKWTWGPPLTKVIIHKLSAEQFLWNRNWDLGWFWAGWQYWKNNFGPIMINFWGRFLCFHRQKEK